MVAAAARQGKPRRTRRQGQRLVSRIGINGVILAGGASSRLGGRNKALLPWQGRSLIEHAVARLRPQVERLWISAHGDARPYHALGLPICLDRASERLGPLAGIASALAHCESPWLLVAPCDNPQPPADLAARLLQADTADRPRFAHCGRDHYLCALIPISLLTPLQAYLDGGGRRVGDWYRQCNAIAVDFSDCPGGFTNLNETGDFRQLTAGSGGGGGD